VKAGATVCKRHRPKAGRNKAQPGVPWVVGDRAPRDLSPAAIEALLVAGDARRRAAREV
jgi:hypothetical protein